MVLIGTASPTPALPAGSQPGMLAVLIDAYFTGLTVGRPRLEGWATQAVDTDYTSGWVFGAGTQAVRIMTRTLTGDDPLPVGEAGRYSARILVFEGSAGVGSVRQGRAQVQLRPGSSAVVVAPWTAYEDTAPSGGGVTWASGVLSVNSTSLWTTRTLRTSVGYTTSVGGGVVGLQRGGLALEVLAPASPRPPTAVLPGAGDEIAQTAPLEFSWLHNASVAGGRQGAYQWRVEATSGWVYWDASAGALTSTEVTNASGASAFTLPGGLLSPLYLARTWQVRTREALDGLWSDWSAARQVVPTVAPTVAVTVAGSLAPRVTLTPTISRPSSVVIAHQVQVLAPGGLLIWDSEVIPTAPTGPVQVPTLAWVNGSTYTFRARVQQTGRAWSAWTDATRVVSWTPPAAPDVVVQAITGDGPGVAVTSQPGDVVTVQRSIDGMAWEHVWVGSAGATAALVDPFAPAHTPVTYRARVERPVDGVLLPSAWATSATVTPTHGGCRLASAVDPITTWQRVPLVSDSGQRTPTPTAFAQTFGSPYPRIMHGATQGRRGSLTLRLPAAESRSLLERLVLAREPLLLQLPPDRDGRPGEVITVTIVSPELAVNRWTQSPNPARLVTLDWVEQPTVTPGGVSYAPATHPVVTA